MYNPPISSSVDEPLPLPPYTEHHFDEQDLPRLAVQNESAPANDYVGSSVSPYQSPPRGSPISESKSDLPPLPPKPKELQYSEGDLSSQSGEVSPFVDPKREPPPVLRPGFIDVRKRKNSSTHTTNSNGEDAGFFY